MPVAPVQPPAPVPQAPLDPEARLQQLPSLIPRKHEIPEYRPQRRPKDRHMWDEVSEEVAQWIEDMAAEIASGLKNGGPAPFAARTTEAEKLAYYQERFFNPDGTPNRPGRQEELERLGVTNYAKAMREVVRERERRQLGISSLQRPNTEMPDMQGEGATESPQEPQGPGAPQGAY